MAINPAQTPQISPGYFFPNQSPETLDLELKLRKHVAALPESSRLAIYEVFSRTLPSFTVTDFALNGHNVVAKQASQQITFPSPVPLVKLSHIMFGYEQWLQRKYCLPGFVEVEADDIVVDCGAYVGGFSISASKVAREVHAFEPDEENFRCLWMNHSFRKNVTTNCMGLYNVTKQMELNISSNSVEHSLLAPDDGPPIATRKIMVVALADYFETKAQPTFVKIEAEGVEPEVYDGLGSIRPRKFAIDVSPERDGQAPVKEFMARLPRDGYETRQRGNVLFARRRESGSGGTVSFAQTREESPATSARLEAGPDRSRLQSLVDTEDLRIVYLPGEANSTEAILTFAGAAQFFAGGPSEEFAGTFLALEQRRPVYFILDQHSSWYNRSGDAIAAFVHERVKFPSLVTLGNSMGGFGALLFGEFLPQTRLVISFCPQYSMKPDVARFENRWREYTGGIMDWKYPVCLASARERVERIVFFGRDCEYERAHSRLIRARLKGTSSSVFTIGGVGHSVAGYFKDRNLLKGLIETTLQGPEPRSDTEQFLRAAAPQIDLDLWQGDAEVAPIAPTES